MKRAIIAAILLLLVAPAAFAWGPATHVYIAKNLTTHASDLNVAYGAIAPDLNQAITNDQYSPYFHATHYGAMNVWQAGVDSGSAAQKAVAFGFATHNEDWGADHTAHITALTLNPTLQKGYVIQKAEALCYLLSQQTHLELGKGFLTTDNCHFVLEYGIELMMRKVDPQLATQLAAASKGRNNQLNPLFMAAFAPMYGGQFAKTIANANDPWRETMYVYSGILQETDDAKALTEMGWFLVGIAQKFQIIPADADPNQVEFLIEIALQDSMYLCKDDVGNELGATIMSVHQNLAQRGIEY